MMEQCEMYRHGYFHAERLQEEKDVQDLKNEVTVMVNRIELLQLHCRLASDIFIPTTYVSKTIHDCKYTRERNIMHLRKLMGQDLGSCSVEELNEITIQIERSLTLIRSRKVTFFLRKGKKGKLTSFLLRKRKKGKLTQRITNKT